MTEAASPQLESLVESIVLECSDPARLLEIYYWSAEPDLLHLMRAVAGMPRTTRIKVSAFTRAFPTATLHAEVDGAELRLIANASNALRPRKPARIAHPKRVKRS